LRAHDFAPFKALNHLPIAMTAHVVYSAIDPRNPATTSAKVIRDIVRGEIGFDGLLVSDDTSMKALSGDFPSKAAAILAAGCDLVLHCNGDMEEMRGIASKTGPLRGRALERADSALAAIHIDDTANETMARAEFATFFEAVA
jgi:beta-N-acetylhexosaminidase